MISPIRSLILSVSALFVAAALLIPSAAQAQFRLTTPATYGDQLFFFYDARTDRVPFLTIANFATESIDVQIAYYNETLTRVLAVEPETLPGLGHIIVDPTQISSVQGNAGLVVVTPVGGNPTRPIVPPSQPNSPGVPPLFGSFTLANTNLGAGFGQNPFARIAVGDNDVRPAPGTIVDGTDVVYQSISPDMLVIPTFFDPRSLSPSTDDGNRVLLASFTDDYSNGAWRIEPRAVSMDAFFDGANGVPIIRTVVNFEGLLFTDLQSLAGPTQLNASGKLSLWVIPGIEPFHNVFGLFSQALGTFSIGQRMPGFELNPPQI